MPIMLIIALLLALLLVIFALQNASTIMVSLWFWHIESSLALILLVSFVMGSIVTILFSIPSIYRHSGQMSDLKKKIKELEKKVQATPNENNPQSDNKGITRL